MASGVAQRLQQRHLDQEFRRVEIGGADFAAALGDAHMQQLARMVPVVERLRRVDALIALQADRLAAEDLGQPVGDLGLADARRAFEQQRLAELERQVERRHQRLVGEIAGGRERRVELVVGQRGGHGARSPRCRVPSRPPLSCRTSPPQVGRLAVSMLRSVLRCRRLAKAFVTANLPT